MKFAVISVRVFLCVYVALLFVLSLAQCILFMRCV